MSVEAVPSFGVGVQDGKVDLVFLRVEIDKEVVNLVQHFLRAGIGTVDLIDDHNRRKLASSALLKT